MCTVFHASCELDGQPAARRYSMLRLGGHQKRGDLAATAGAKDRSRL
ncbi:MAG: hypothetical protein HYY29_05530 [Chloroflexi bacterium]|nr:hypothetical protein [Chloroflexota bacterium]